MPKYDPSKNEFRTKIQINDNRYRITVPKPIGELGPHQGSYEITKDNVMVWSLNIVSFVNDPTYFKVYRKGDNDIDFEISKNLKNLISIWKFDGFDTAISIRCHKEFEYKHLPPDHPLSDIEIDESGNPIGTYFEEPRHLDDLEEFQYGGFRWEFKFDNNLLHVTFLNREELFDYDERQSLEEDYRINPEDYE